MDPQATAEQANGIMHREAKVLAFTSFVVNGVEVNLTMREGSTADEAKSLLLEMGQITKWLKDLNASFNLSRNAQDGMVAKTRREAVNGASVEDPDGLPMKAASERSRNGTAPPAPNNDRLTFQAQRLIGESRKGKDYWKVAGGRFAKFGVRVWPEVLEAAGIDVDSLDTSQEYELSLTAVYIEEDGKPVKVISLE